MNKQDWKWFFQSPTFLYIQFRKRNCGTVCIQEMLWYESKSFKEFQFEPNTQEVLDVKSHTTTTTKGKKYNIVSDPITRLSTHNKAQSFTVIIWLFWHGNHLLMNNTCWPILPNLIYMPLICLRAATWGYGGLSGKERWEFTLQRVSGKQDIYFEKC